MARTSRPETPDALQGFHASDIRVSDDGRSIIEPLNDTTRGQIREEEPSFAGLDPRLHKTLRASLPACVSRSTLAAGPSSSPRTL